MIELHYAQSLDPLVEAFASSVKELQLGSPLTPVTVILSDIKIKGRFGDTTVVYPAAQQFIKMRLASLLGIFANIEFRGVFEFLAQLFERTIHNLHVLRNHELRVLVYECLREPTEFMAPELQRWREELALEASDHDEAEERIFEVASRIARLFDAYSQRLHSRSQNDLRELVEAGTLSGVKERRQIALWRVLFDEKGRLHQRFLTDKKWQCTFISKVLEEILQKGLRLNLPAVLHVFCFGEPESLLLHALELLHLSTHVKVYALNPCAEFFEDIFEGNAPDSKSRASIIDLSLDNTSFSQLDSAVAESLPLRFWANSLYPVVLALNQLANYQFEWHKNRRASAASPGTLLQALKNCILTRTLPDQSVTSLLPDCDKSIRILPCSSIPEEVQTVAREIYSILAEENNRNLEKPIRLHEIAVIFPDSERDLYLPHVESVFAGELQIPINVVNPPLGAQSRIIDAVERLLELPTSKFTRRDVLSLLLHSAISGLESGAQADQWRTWCEELGIAFGVDENDFHGSYLPRDVLHWDQALKRLALGAFLGEDDNGETDFFEASSGARYLPLELHQDETESAARLIRLARSLISYASRLKNSRLTLEEWSTEIADYIKAFVKVESVQDERALACCLEAIDSIRYTKFTKRPTSYEIARRLVMYLLADLEPQMGNLLFNGVIVGSLSTLFTIPFKVVFFLGLTNGKFPSYEQADPYDIRPAKLLYGRTSLAERERFWFLQTILNTTERLTLSYVCYDEETGAEIRPSPVLNEFNAVLSAYFGANTLSALTIQHPGLSAPQEQCHEPERKKGEMEPGRETHTEPVPEISTMLQADSEKSQTCIPNVRGYTAPHLVIPQTLDRKSSQATGVASYPQYLPLRALVEFLKCPIQAHAKYILRIEDDKAEPDVDDEPTELSALNRASMLREAFWQARGKLREAKFIYKRLFELAQAKGQAPFGVLADSQLETDLQLLESWHLAVDKLKLPNLEQWKQVCLERAQERARVDVILEPLIVEPTRLTPSEGMTYHGLDQALPIKLYGRLPRLSPSFNASLNLVVHKDIVVRDFIEQVLSAIVLAAVGKLDDCQFRAVVIGADTEQKDPWKEVLLNPPSREESKEYLANLVGELLFSSEFYFMPIEAVERALKTRCHKESLPHEQNLRELIEQLRQDENARCASDYGPLKDVRRRFTVPASDQIITEIIDRRFGPIMDALFFTNR